MREAILEILRQEVNISGEQLGKRLHISRTAVWKHIKELRKMGYQINSSSKLGYSFVGRTNLLLPDEVKQNLETNTIGKQIRHYLDVTSTQDVAEGLARNGADEGTVVIAESQTKGRGRKARDWVSPSEVGLYLSIILRPDLAPSQIIQIPLVAGVAVCRAIKKVTALQPRIKWPNDVFIGGKKVAGILTEMRCEVDKVNYVVLGIGVNVNTPGPFLEKMTGGIGTSLGDQSQGLVSRLEFVQNLFREFEILYMKFLASGFESVRKEWIKFNNTIGSMVKISDDGEEVEGKAIDIDEDGFLLIRLDNGDIKRIVHGDVSVSKYMT